MMVWRPDILQEMTRGCQRVFPAPEDALSGFKNWRKYQQVATILLPLGCFRHPHTPPAHIAACCHATIGSMPQR